jgi:hypothetical protein
MKPRSIVFIALLALILVSLAALAYTGTFTRMHADDFCIAGSNIQQGFFKSISFWYQNWAGRYSYFVASHLVSLTGPFAAAYFPAAVIALWTLALGWALLPLLRRAGWPHPRLLAFSAGGLILLVTLSTLPGIFQSIYWRDGQVNYSYPMLLETLLAGMLLRAWLEPAWPPAGYMAAGFALALVSGGFAEAFGGMHVGVLALALVAALLLARGPARRRLLPILGACLAGALVAMAIEVTAPGNAVRQNALAGGAGPLRVITFSLRNALVVAGKLVLQHPGWTLLLLAVPFLAAWWLVPSATAERARPRLRDLWAAPWFRGVVILPICGLLAAAAACAPVVLGMNAYPDDRTILLPQTAWVAAAALSSALLGLGLRRLGWLPRPSTHQWLGRALPAALVVALALAGGASVVSAAQSAPALAAYVQQWDARDAQLRAARLQGVTDITVYGLPNRGGISDLKADPGNWVNACMAEYYGFHSITGK